MRILKGAYPLRDRRLHLSLDHDLDLGGEPAWLRLSGGNGLGKTSFIEKVLIPALQAGKMPFLYLGQDFQTQLYTLKAALAVSQTAALPGDIAGLLTLWVRRHHHARVFILDEFDKHADHMRRILKVSREFIRTYVTVSHAQQPISPDPSFTPRTLQFRALSDRNGVLNVAIGELRP